MVTYDFKSIVTYDFKPIVTYDFKPMVTHDFKQMVTYDFTLTNNYTRWQCPDNACNIFRCMDFKQPMMNH